MGSTDHTTIDSAVLERCVFSVDDNDFSWADIIAHAALHDQLEPLLDATLRRIGAAAGYPHDDDPETIQRAATATRYRLNLISAEETQCWLHACGLTLDDMAQYVVRVLAEDAATDLPGGTEWPDEVFDVLWADALFDNALVSLVEPLTLEALALAAKAADAESVTSHTSMFTERCEKMPPQLRAIVRPRLDQMVALRASFAIFAAEQTDAALSSALAQHRTDTIQLTYSELQFSNINVANEAYLCAIIDGADFDDLAERTKTACTQHEIFAGDLDTMLQSTLVSAQPGEIVKAYAEDEYRLIMLDSKNDPDLTAAPVRTRLTRRLVATALHSQYGSRLKWQIPILTS